jgi:poly-gamma-glutamate synthesis protein (capsule biosynthesis protein)
MTYSQFDGRLVSALLIIAFTVSACGVQNPQPPLLVPTTAPTKPVEAASPEPATPTRKITPPIPTQTLLPPISIWLAPYLPPVFSETLQLAPGIIHADESESAAFRLQVGGGDPFSQWVYALVAPFPTIADGVSEDELRAAWQGNNPATFPDQPILMDDSTLGVFSAVWGPPAAGTVKAMPAENLLDYAWGNQPAWAIVPFEELEPRWKVLKIDGRSPIDESFDPAVYPLTVSFSLAPNQDQPSDPDELLAAWQPSNRDEGQMTTVILTGVTALVRATAETMRRKGITYPAQDIRDWLRSADITHVSNEIPFAADCPFPDARQTDLVFCSNPAYVDLLLDIGTDVIELTGDHFGDWGAEAMRFTLDLYRQNSLAYYGGGYDLEEARRPLLIEHNGNRLAFIGCNAKEPGYGTAREDNPGAVHCDYDWLEAEIARLRADGYLPIVTFQNTEYYSYVPQPKLIREFRPSAEAGAVIVSGSQAHQPHGMEFYQDAFIHYGLGNLFFYQ